MPEDRPGECGTVGAGSCAGMKRRTGEAGALVLPAG